MMITMFEGGSPWPEIATKWQKMTGRKAQKSTLPNRYQRIKDKLVVMRDEDRVFMLEARSEVNTAWETERWERMAALIEEKGGQKYTVSLHTTVLFELLLTTFRATKSNASTRR